MDEFGFEYLSIIKECMDKVYGEKPNLINQNGRRSSHEQSISFRLGYYLSDALKDKKGYFIDQVWPDWGDDRPFECASLCTNAYGKCFVLADGSFGRHTVWRR
mgnify:CR=1 FL=1